MKLINHTLLFLSAILFVTVSLWALLFYYQLLTQVKTTIDEGLANYKIVIIDKLKADSILVQQHSFMDNYYIIKSVNEAYALQIRDSYKDTLVYSNIKNNYYRSRLLTTAFVATDGKYYQMKVFSQELDRGDLIGKLATSLLWLYLFMFLSIIVVNNFVLKKTWKPFYQVLKNMNDFRLEKGDLQNPVQTRILEFSMLNKSIIKLLKTNVDIFNSQKQFIENASHELQTPIAIGINKLELLAGDSNLSSEQIQKIGDIIEAFQRLSSLNKSLLLLSKIENKQFIADELINFNESFSRIIHDFSDFTDFQKLEIKYHQDGVWVYQMNKDLAEILIMNLVKNAIIHNRPGGDLTIRLTDSSFTIENGSNEPEIPDDKIFKRFNKNQKSKNSSGLGLAVVKAIADVSGLLVSYSHNGKHVFRVTQFLS